jgi:hypothetical protein
MAVIQANVDLFQEICPINRGPSGCFGGRVRKQPPNARLLRGEP